MIPMYKPCPVCGTTDLAIVQIDEDTIPHLCCTNCKAHIEVALWNEAKKKETP